MSYEGLNFIQHYLITKILFEFSVLNHLTNYFTKKLLYKSFSLVPGHEVNIQTHVRNATRKQPKLYAVNKQLLYGVLGVFFMSRLKCYFYVTVVWPWCAKA